MGKSFSNKGNSRDKGPSPGSFMGQRTKKEGQCAGTERATAGRPGVESGGMRLGLHAMDSDSGHSRALEVMVRSLAFSLNEKGKP